MLVGSKKIFINYSIKTLGQINLTFFVNNSGFLYFNINKIQIEVSRVDGGVKFETNSLKLTGHISEAFFLYLLCLIYFLP
jgi:hypothetical protein